MIALDMWRSTRCTGCGGDLTETSEHDDWDVPPPLQCNKCEAVAIRQDTYATDYKHMNSLHWAAKRRG